MTNKSIIESNSSLPDIEILFAYIKGTASKEEQLIVDTWMKAKEENEKELLQIARIYYADQTYERIISRNPMPALTNVQRKIKNKKQKIWISRSATVAACLAGVVVLSYFLSYWKGAEAGIESQWITIQTNPGMRTQITLPDGTIAHLNSETTLSYPLPYDKKARQVHLEGEAFFRVSKQTKQPFIVSIPDSRIKVKVLGTEFNLQAFKGENTIETTLLSGSIDLEMTDGDGNIHEKRLYPSEKATYFIAEENMSIKRVNALYDVAWTEGILMFYNTPVPEVLKRLSHFYSVKFDIKDPIIETYRFTGTFQNRQLSQILEYLKISSNINFKIHHATEDDSSGLKHTTITLCKKEKHV